MIFALLSVATEGKERRSDDYLEYKLDGSDSECSAAQYKSQIGCIGQFLKC